MSARVGKWKWVDMGSRGGGLYNLEDDPGEKKDLSASEPEALAMVKARLGKWLETMDAAEPRGPFRDF